MIDVDELLLEVEDRMDRAIAAYEGQLQGVRTGRASTRLVEQLPVEHYGQRMPLNQLATLGAPEAQLITIQPWDRGAANAIIRAIQTSDLGIMPQDDGQMIRLPIPSLTEERRREMVRQLHQKTEDARVSVRNARRGGMDELRKALRGHEVSEDEERHAHGEIDKVTQEHVERLDRLGQQKEQELLAV